MDVEYVEYVEYTVIMCDGCDWGGYKQQVKERIVEAFHATLLADWQNVIFFDFGPQWPNSHEVSSKLFKFCQSAYYIADSCPTEIVRILP